VKPIHITVADGDGGPGRKGCSEGRRDHTLAPFGAKRTSGMLVVALFDLIDGSQRATGVYCGVGGCRGWAEWPH
jgi:hypothetical protein